MTNEDDRHRPSYRPDEPDEPDRNGHGMSERHRGDIDPGLEALLAAAIRGPGTGLDAGAEKRAVAAFRTARDAGAHRARTRRRDDWRPREQRRAARSLKTTLSVLCASLAVGGVAVAGIGSYGTPGHGSADERKPRTSTPQSPAAEPSRTAAPAQPDRPDTAKDTEAHCRAYEKGNGKEQGKALDATAWQRLVAAAGGEGNVAAYCAQQLATAESEPGKAEKTAKSEKAATAEKTAKGRKK